MMSGRVLRLKWILPLLWVGLAPPSTLAQTNLVPNASLEQAAPGDPTTPTRYDTDDWGAVQGTFTYRGDGGAEGARYVRTEVTATGEAGDAKWMTAPIPVPPGGRLFKIGLSYRANVESEVLVQALGPAGEEEWLYVTDLAPATDWTGIAGSVTLPAFAVNFRVMHVVRLLGWVDSDSFWASQVMLDGAPATVTITTDDGWLSMYEHAFPVLQSLGIRASHYMITDFIDAPGYEEYMTSAQMLELAKAGHEIGSHSFGHKKMTEIDAAELHSNIFGTYELLNNYGLDVVGFVPPYGAYNQAVIAEVEKRFAYLRTVEAGSNLKPYKTYELKAYVVVDTTTIEQLDSWYKDAWANDGWLILLYHRFADPTVDELFVTPDNFRAQMEYLVNQKANILPLGEVLGMWAPQSGITPPDSP